MLLFMSREKWPKRLFHDDANTRAYSPYGKMRGSKPSARRVRLTKWALKHASMPMMQRRSLSNSFTKDTYFSSSSSTFASFSSAVSKPSVNQP